MEKIEILNEDGQILNMELAFAFSCKENSKNYVALVNKNTIFEKNSRYSNIDIFEVIKNNINKIYVSDIPDSDWENVKRALQYNVFAKMN